MTSGPRPGGPLTDRDYAVLARVFGFANKEQMRDFAEMEQFRADGFTPPVEAFLCADCGTWFEGDFHAGCPTRAARL
jgi:hypothetical protein